MKKGKPGRKAWHPERYPFCGCKLEKGKRIEKCEKHKEKK